MYSYITEDVCWSHQYQAFVYTRGTKNTNNIKHEQLEGSEQERSLDFSPIFESVHMPKFNYFWTLSKMAEKSRDRSCSEPSNFSIKARNKQGRGNDESSHNHRKKEQLSIFETLRHEEKCMFFSDITRPWNFSLIVTWAFTDHEKRWWQALAKVRGMSAAVLEEPKSAAFCAFHCLK